jgi:hypothetical protein
MIYLIPSGVMEEMVGFGMVTYVPVATGNLICHVPGIGLYPLSGINASILSA